MKKALTTEITRQDEEGCLAKFLLNKEHEVHRIKRRASFFNTDRIDYLCHMNGNPKITHLLVRKNYPYTL